MMKAMDLEARQGRTSPRTLARALEEHGIHVRRCATGDAMRDGNIVVANMVHVEVPTFEGHPRVVVHTFYDETRCYPPRQCVTELARDIRDALSGIPSAAASCSIH
jgi:hypothetical protein